MRFRKNTYDLWSIRTLQIAMPGNTGLLHLGQETGWKHPGYSVEAYFFRRILEATGYYNPGLRVGYDPYVPQKRTGLELSQPAVAKYCNQLQEWISNSGTEDRDEILAQLIRMSLWGNQSDLSMWPAGQNSGPQLRSSYQGEKPLESQILVDDSLQLAKHLSNHTGQDRQVDFILDNAGLELVHDLGLADFLLTHQRAGFVRFHLKAQPFYVSDAMVKDILYRKQVDQVILKRGMPVAAVTKYGEAFPADMIVFNLPPDNISRLLSPLGELSKKQQSKQPDDGWGAFMIYAGLDNATIPKDYPLHHQIIRQRPLGEGNTTFMSFSPEWDPHRAPHGQRAVTLSTHTSLSRWWNLYESNPTEYEELKSSYMEKLITSAEIALPGFRQGVTYLMPGTPVTFQHYTRRLNGWVGGYPQTSLFRAQHPQIGDGLWMVGDSIFPGQSIAATAIGGLRVAHNIQKRMGISRKDMDQYLSDRKLSDSRIAQGFL